jgi:hypothetical protein
MNRRNGNDNVPHSFWDLSRAKSKGEADTRLQATSSRRTVGSALEPIRFERGDRGMCGDDR